MPVHYKLSMCNQCSIIVLRVILNEMYTTFYEFISEIAQAQMV